MTVHKKKILKTISEWFLYIILVTGIGFLPIALGIAPTLLIDGKLLFIMPHKILGYIFYILILYHAFIHRKWYKAWISGKIKKTRNSQITKSISVLFLLIIILFLFGDLLPRKIYAVSHSGIGLIWIILMICHIKIKRNASRKRSGKIS